MIQPILKPYFLSLFSKASLPSLSCPSNSFFLSYQYPSRDFRIGINLITSAVPLHAVVDVVVSVISSQFQSHPGINIIIRQFIACLIKINPSSTIISCFSINTNALDTVTPSLRLVRNPSEKERFPTSGNDKKRKNNKCVCISNYSAKKFFTLLIFLLDVIKQTIYF